VTRDDFLALGVAARVRAFQALEHADQRRLWRELRPGERIDLTRLLHLARTPGARLEPLTTEQTSRPARPRRERAPLAAMTSRQMKPLTLGTVAQERGERRPRRTASSRPER
jgi:hypothetical protein